MKRLGVLCMVLAMVCGFAGMSLAADDTVKIGVFLPLTGQNAFGGQLELEGVQMAHKEMGKILGACELTVGTRLHSAIISMNFATPAIAINYEHKSAGIMQQLGLPEMAIDIRPLLDGSLQAMVADTLGQLPALNTRLNEAVSRERQTGMQMVKSVLERIGEAK